MRPVQHPSNNGVLGAPGGHDQNALPCAALAVTRTKVTDLELPVVYSFWKPSPNEIELLRDGCFVRVGVLGETIPPIQLEVCP